MHNQLSNELAPSWFPQGQAWEFATTEKIQENEYTNINYENKKTDGELLPFLYLFVHEEDPSGGFFYLPPAQTLLSQKSNQYLSQLFQRPG